MEELDVPLFNDRADATKQLLEKIPYLDPANSIVLGIPRGGVPMAAQIAQARQIPLDILMIRKLSLPSNPEYAIGAVSLQEHWIDETFNISQAELDQCIEGGRSLLRMRDRLYRKNRPFPNLQNKTVLLVDDGIATGRTLAHAIKMIRALKPGAIWVAVPVSSKEAAILIAPQVDRFICLYQPKPFLAVGRFYHSFPSVSDERVIESMQVAVRSGETT
jgi:putative phosphoribosyl transferase